MPMKNVPIARNELPQQSGSSGESNLASTKFKSPDVATGYVGDAGALAIKLRSDQFGQSIVLQ